LSFDIFGLSALGNTDQVLNWADQRAYQFNKRTGKGARKMKKKNSSQQTPYASPIREDSRIYVAGHRGLVGSAIVRQLREKGFDNLILRTHQELDLTRQAEVEAFFQSEQPDVIAQ